MKKIILFLTFFFFQIFFTNADFTQEIKKIPNSKEILNQIDIFFEKNNSKEKLEKISEKIENILKSERKFSEKEKLILSYFYLKSKNNLNILDAEKRILEIEKNIISENDKKFIEKDILNLQKNISKNFINFENNLKINSSLKIFFEKNEKNFSYENKNIETKIWKNLDFETKINDLEIKNIENEIFIKAKNLDFLKNFTEKNILEKIENNDFIKLDNFENLEENIEILKNFIEKIKLEKSLFEAYKKENNKNFLKISKNFCEIFENKKCSEKYVKDFSKNFEIYLEIEKNYKKIFLNFTDSYTNLKSEIYFSYENILEKINIYSDFPNIFSKNLDFFEFIWEKWKKLDFILKTTQSDIFLNSKFDEKWKIIFMKTEFSSSFLKWNLFFEKNILKADFSSKNSKILFDLVLDEKYFPISWKAKIYFKNILDFEISWKNYDFKGKSIFWDIILEKSFIFKENFLKFDGILKNNDFILKIFSENIFEKIKDFEVKIPENYKYFSEIN